MGCFAALALLVALAAAQNVVLQWPGSDGATETVLRGGTVQLQGLPANASVSVAGVCLDNANSTTGPLSTDVSFFVSSDCLGAARLTLAVYDVSVDLSSSSASLYVNVSPGHAGASNLTFSRQPGNVVRVSGAAGLQAVQLGAVPTPAQVGPFLLVPVVLPAALYRTPAGQSLLLLARSTVTDVVVSPASLGGAVTLGLNQRLVFQSSSGSSAAPFYPRLSDASGSVYPFSDLRYSLAFDPSGADTANRGAIFANYSAPLSGAASVWASPFFRTSGVYWYRDLFSSSAALLRVSVRDANGADPTLPPAGVPQFESYFATSAQGVECSCNFGAQPQCSDS
jgi:hypothetical protein